MCPQLLDLGRGINVFEKALDGRKFSHGKHTPFGSAAIGVSAAEPKHEWFARQHDHPAKVFGDHSLDGDTALFEIFSQPLSQCFAIAPRICFFLLTVHGLEELSLECDLWISAHDDAQRAGNRRCAALSRSVQRPKGARLTGGLGHEPKVIR